MNHIERLFGCATANVVLFFLVAPVLAAELPLQNIQLPPGFSIHVYSADVRGARSLALSQKGTLFVGTRDEGVVYAVVDANHDGRADRVRTVAKGLNSPNGVALHDGSLYVAEISRILRLDDIENRLDNPPEPQVVYDRLPDKKHHGWKFIAFGPDGLLYVPIGAPCNVCQTPDPFATISRMRPDGTNFEVFARGIRNTVGFDWQPETNVLWFTDNGRDNLGDDIPPDELDRAPKPGLHFGFPYCHGNGIRDPDEGGPACETYVPPALELGPHVAALGMRFYRGSMFPPEYRDRVFIAEHGSWNRSEKIGYRVVSARIRGDRADDVQVFAQGWLNRGGVWGRPVDLLVAPDGALLVSDDRTGAIYRITYAAPGS